MEKRRVYQVAKEKKLSSDALISMLKSMEFEVKSHMSVVTEEMLDAITKKIEEEKKSSIQEVQRQKEKEETRKREVAKARREAAAETQKGDAPQRSLRAIRRQAELGGSGQSRGAVPPTIPGKGTDDRRRGKRRRRDEPVEQREQPGEKTDRDGVAPHLQLPPTRAAAGAVDASAGGNLPMPRRYRTTSGKPSHKSPRAGCVAVTIAAPGRAGMEMARD